MANCASAWANHASGPAVQNVGSLTDTAAAFDESVFGILDLDARSVELEIV